VSLHALHVSHLARWTRFQEYSQLLARLQRKVHGFARFSHDKMEQHMDWSEKVSHRLRGPPTQCPLPFIPTRDLPLQVIPHWAVVVRDHNGIAGMLAYQVT
jgi:hypothetical protein